MKNLSRRLFIGMSALSATTVCAQVSLLQTLKLPESYERVANILKKHYPMPASSEMLIKNFYERLLTTAEQTRDPKYFNQLLDEKQAEERLQSYVIEEFLALTPPSRARIRCVSKRQENQVNGAGFVWPSE